MADERRPQASAGTTLRVELGDWAHMREACGALRFAVFVDEQGVPADIEIDAHDAVSLHALARGPGGDVLGCGRLLPDGHIGRMAVARGARGQGVGSAVLRALMQAASARGHAEAILNAQDQAVPFYAKHGYRVSSAPFDDAGIVHVEMRALLLPVASVGRV